MKEKLKGAGRYIYQEGTVYIILVALIVFFSIFNPKFLSSRNLYNLITQSTYIVIAGMGICFVMISGGIDLSVGYQMAVCGCVAAIIMLETTLPVWVVWPVCIVLGLPLDVYLAIAVVAATWIVLNKTHFGRDVLAVGGNKECERLSGIRSDLIQTLCFTLTGGIFAIATLDMLAQQNQTSATTGPGTEITCLTAAIIGGISMMGGKGNVVGMVAGIFVMQMIANGMQLAGWGTYTQYIVKGVILLLAISFDAIKNYPKPVVRVHKEKAETTKAA